VALIRGNQIIVGNVGDSHCVLSRNGQVQWLFSFLGGSFSFVVMNVFSWCMTILISILSEGNWAIHRSHNWWYWFSSHSKWWYLVSPELKITQEAVYLWLSSKCSYFIQN
jgi:hypothetical protein